MSPDSRPPVVVVTGPTASGKTPLAIDLAEHFGGEIVSADSMQVYRYLDIGTAKPSAEQRARVPHHCLDCVTPDVDYSAGRYAEEARAAAVGIHGKGRVVILAGGTGLYIRAFLEGLLVGGAADPGFRDGLEREHAAAVAAGDPERLHRRLAATDPEAAAGVHPHDLRRIVRSLELSRGAPASQQRRDHGFADRPYRVLHLAIDPGPGPLRARIDARCRKMIAAGLLQEVRDLRERGYGPELRPLQAIGYRHMHAVVAGSDTLEGVLPLMQRDTRRFARRQRTWLRAVPEAIWMRPEERGPLWKTVEGFLAGGQ